MIRRNRWAFAIGTLGRDMVYSMMALFLIVFLTEVLDVDDATLWWINGILLAARVLDAFTDIIMGGIIDNTATRWGPYKPWIASGAVLVGVLTVLLFTDMGLRGPTLVFAFTVVYLAWGLSFTMNDIGYWSLLPSLTNDPNERERLSALTKVFATLGLFTTVVGIVPLTAMLGGGAPAWTTFAACAVTVMLLGQAVTLFGVREPAHRPPQERTKVRELFGIITGNDQLVWTAIAMMLFLIGYNTTTSFGVYFFKYAYRDESMYAPFAAILGGAQLLGFALFPVLRRRMSRRNLFTLAMSLVVSGYLVFFFSPMNLIPIGISGLLLFSGQAMVVVLMIVSLADCIEYGHWKLGRRNGAVTFAVQPFINKVGGAVATAATGATLILTGINEASGPDDVTQGGLLGLRTMMLIFPLLLMAISYLIYRRGYRIDGPIREQILADLAARGEQEHI